MDLLPFALLGWLVGGIALLFFAGWRCLVHSQNAGHDPYPAGPRTLILSFFVAWFYCLWLRKWGAAALFVVALGWLIGPPLYLFAPWESRPHVRLPSLADPAPAAPPAEAPAVFTGERPCE